MIMATVKSYSLKNMSDAVARDDGRAIKFRFLTHSDEELECECGVEAIPQIVARLTAALEQAAVNSTPKGQKVVSQPIVADDAEVSLNTAQKIVIATFFASPHCGIPFAMTAQLADKVSSGLAVAVAKARPSTTPGSMS
jgi:hypothetical protein